MVIWIEFLNSLCSFLIQSFFLLKICLFDIMSLRHLARWTLFHSALGSFDTLFVRHSSFDTLTYYRDIHRSHCLFLLLDEIMCRFYYIYQDNLIKLTLFWYLSRLCNLYSKKILKNKKMKKIMWITEHIKNVFRKLGLGFSLRV